MEEKKKAKFNPGRIVATKGVAERMEKDAAFDEFCEMSLRRHLDGDWGEMIDEDRMRNKEALENGEDSLYSVYTFPKTNETIWIIIEGDRSATTILYPSDY